MADAPVPSTSVRSRTFAALDNPDYRRYYIGQGISLIGTWLQAAAVNWLVFEQTNSEYWLGIVGAASLLPGLLVGLIAGEFADRFAPRKMILVMEAGQMALAFALAALVSFDIIEVPILILILALTRICVTFEMPSRQVFLYEIVGRADLTNAIALNSGLFNASRVLGPALAGFFYASFGPTACFLLNGTSYLGALAALLMIPRGHTRAGAGTKGPGTGFGGVAYLWHDRKIAMHFLLMAFFGVVGMGFDAMIPAYARRVVQTDVVGYSVILACSGIGATLGALIVASLGGIKRKEGLVLAGLVLFGGSLAAAAVLPPLAGSILEGKGRLVVASACVLGVGFGAVLFYAATQTLIQMTVPDHLRGRVMGIWMIVYSGSVPLGSLWTGRLASSLGVTTAIVISASLCLVVALVGISSKSLFHEDKRPEPLGE